MPVGDAQAAGRFAAALPAQLRRSRPAQVLERSLASGRLAHAILLHGEDMRELVAVADAMAVALLDCRPDELNTHPDLIALRPSGKARQIRIGERGEAAENTMRGFLRQINQTPNRGLRKVAAVYDADRMNTATANAFLKTLEEPPADSTMLLLSTRPYDLLDTIRSRCFHFRIGAGKGADRDARWQAWLDRYATWLGRAADRPRGSREVAQAVLGLYGLSQSFSEVLGSLSDEAWERESANLPPNLPDEQLAAMESGARKGLRQLLFAEVESATVDYVHKDTSSGMVLALFRVHAEIERAARLCEVFNLKEDAALESFLLSSLRLWAQGVPSR
jgi:DNA polymerase-3 subunit delta'